MKKIDMKKLKPKISALPKNGKSKLSQAKMLLCICATKGNMPLSINNEVVKWINQFSKKVTGRIISK